MTLVVRVLQIRGQQDMVHRIETAGGKIYRQFPFQFIVAIEFRNNDLNQDVLQKVSGLKRLRTLIMSGAEIEDTAYAALQHLQNVKLLDLSETGFADEHASLLSEVETLRILELSQTRIGNESIKQLSHLPIESLAVQQCKIDDTAILEFAKMKQLRFLDIRGTGTTPEAVESLKEALPNCVIKWAANE